MNEVMAIYAKCPSRTVLRRIGFTLFREYPKVCVNLQTDVR